MTPGMMGKKHLQQINGIHRGNSGDRQSSARITALSSALCCLLRVGRGRALPQVAGRLQPTTTPALRLHYICKSAASHQHASRWEGKRGAHSDHCCFGRTVSNETSTPHICPWESCCCKPNHVHTGPSNSVVITWISPKTPV